MNDPRKTEQSNTTQGFAQESGARGGTSPRPFPLAEIFGYPASNLTPHAVRERTREICPFHNISVKCTKSSVQHPIGVCSINYGGQVHITCPVRFRQNWRIVDDAAAFFFPNRPPDAPIPPVLREVRLPDAQGKATGNIDLVLLDVDDSGKIVDYGAIEVQAVYITGNVRTLFRHYLDAQNAGTDYQAGWFANKAPHPDYLSSSRKRLVPQLLYKGHILHAWGRKIAVAVQSTFFDTLPKLDTVDPQDAEVAWLIYDLVRDNSTDLYELTLARIVYTKFKPALESITIPAVGDEQKFLKHLQSRVGVPQLPPDVTQVGNPLASEAVEDDAGSEDNDFITEGDEDLI